MRVIFTFLVMIIWVVQSTAQIITFDDQGYTPGQMLPNPYSITNSGEGFLFTISGGGTTNHFYRTTEGSCGSSGMSHIYSGNTAQTTWTIETTSGNEINLGTIQFDNVFACFNFSYNLILEGFKNTVSTGTQAFTVSGLNSIFVSNSNFDDVDRIVITSSNLGNLGIDNINWAMSTLSISNNTHRNQIAIYPNPVSNFITIKGLKQSETYHLFDIHGKLIKRGIAENNMTIDLRDVLVGLYFLKINENQVIKLIKK